MTILRRALPVLAAGLACAAPPAALAQSPSPEQRIAQVRAGLDVLDDFAVRPPCAAQPRPERWTSATPPDRGRADPVISAHRGALTLAPENTIESYQYAFAYGVDLVEVDIQQTKDGRFVALHDDTVDRTTEGTGSIRDLTYAEVRRLNAADYAPWKGGEFDPARIIPVEDVMRLAARVGGGLELDIKASVTEEGELAELVESYGLVEESIFNSADVRILQAAPGANLIYNRDRFESPSLIHEIGQVFSVFGSRLDEYTPESIAAAHDACGIVMPHAYDEGPAEEVAQFELARSIGADGVQTNQPALILAAAGQPAPSRLRSRNGELCLVSAEHRLGFPQKAIELRRGRKTTTLTTGYGGCVEVPTPGWRNASALFAGDGSVRPAAAVVRD